MKKLKLLLFAFFVSNLASAQLANSLTIQYIPRIKEQSLSLIYHKSEKLAFHFNAGYIYGYTWFKYVRPNIEDTVRGFTTKGNGIALRFGTRFCRLKSDKYEVYAEPFIMYKYYAYQDSLFYRILNTNDTAYRNKYGSYPYQKMFDKMMNYSRSGIQLGIMIGAQFYFPKNFTGSINLGFSLRQQSYSNGYSTPGASLHLNVGIGYVFRKQEKGKN
jgi:hypothetical protein